MKNLLDTIETMASYFGSVKRIPDTDIDIIEIPFYTIGQAQDCKESIQSYLPDDCSSIIINGNIINRPSVIIYKSK